MYENGNNTMIYEPEASVYVIYNIVCRSSIYNVRSGTLLEIATRDGIDWPRKIKIHFYFYFSLRKMFSFYKNAS